MMDLPDVIESSQTTAEALQSFGKNAGAQVLWTILKVLVAVFITGAVGMATSDIRDMRNDIKDVARQTELQDKNQAVMDQKVQSLQKVSDATVETLQVLSNTVQHNSDDIGTLKETEALRGRPRQ